MEIDYPHNLDLAEARERLGALGEYLFNRHSIRVTWNDNAATFDGKYLMIKIEGRLTLEPSRIHFTGKDPGRLWRNKALKYLNEKLEMYLDPNTPVEELPRRKV